MKYIPAIIVTIVILIVVSIPGRSIPRFGFNGLDKTAHLLFFCTWSLSVQFGFTTRSRWRWILFAGIIFGLITEVIQIFVKERSFDFFDVLFDTFGLMVAAWIGPTVMPWAEKIWPLSRWIDKK